VFYGISLVLRTIWPALDGFEQTLILVSLGAACLVNFRRNRTFHCAFTGPLFLCAAVIAALIEAGIWSIDPRALWGVVLATAGLVFVLEWRTVGPDAHRQGH
jgi:hypothetical protein